MNSEPVEIPVPEPDSVASDGKQQPISSAEVIPPSTPTSGLVVVDHLEGFIVSKPKALGGELAGTLIVAMLKQANQDLTLSREENREIRRQLDTTQKALSASETRCAVLDTENRFEKDHRVVRNLLLTIGLTMISVAVGMYTSGLYVDAKVVGFLGLIAFIFGWIGTSGWKKR